MSILQPGERAPDFSLKTTPDQQVALHDFLGQPVVLVFYPADWSPVCTDQLSLYNEIMSEFRRFNAEIMGISVDGVWCHLAFAKDRKLTFPLMSDFEPKGKVSQAYGAYDGRVGESTRSLFVIDPQGMVAWSHLSPDGINPGADGILAALENIGNPRPGKKKGVTTR
ncbi:MAG: redoxin domain-containing protein [Thaumarchaeota archaeon]|nr:redoxin domain-containing protein [Nitrososphaerota archaeon]